MADEFHTGLCSTMSWWNTMRNPTSFDLPPSISCSTATRDITTTESISWSTQPFLPVEFNQIQTGFEDSSMMTDQTLSPGLFEPAVYMINGLQPASWSKFSGSATHNQLSRVSSPSKQQMSFCNNTPFWNPSTANSAPVKIPEPRFEDESTVSNLIPMKTSETKRHGSDCDHQPAAKKARTATPSPLPTFKVRKEKLGDRITALQQLVSPFGKTDTGSVLHEAIEYIKFLHGQVGALSTPYLKNGHQMQHQMSMESSKDGGVQDLRSRGLCLVPISSTFAVASETPMEFWAPTFLGSYR